MRTIDLTLLIGYILCLASWTEAQSPVTRSDPGFVERDPLPLTIPQRVACSPVKVVGQLDFEDSGNTCGAENNLTSYAGQCTVSNVSYRGEDVVYRIELNDGNRVGFELDIEGSSGDLMLALVYPHCNEGRDCVVNSVDFMGAGVGPEEIQARSYPPGIYHLYVDSAFEAGTPGSCGKYNLRIYGTNPRTADLEVAEVDRMDGVFGGNSLTYKLKVTNKSPFDATGVQMIAELRDVVSFEAPDGCAHESGSEGKGGTVTCRIGKLEADDGTQSEGVFKEKRIRVKVDPSFTGILDAKVEVNANEIDPDESNNSIPLETTVTAKADLVMFKSGKTDPVVAGSEKPLVYELRVVNDGPSDASGIEVIDSLPRGVRFVGGDSDCQEETLGKVVCKFEDLAAGSESREREIEVSVDPSTKCKVINKAEVSINEIDAPKDPPRNNEAKVETEVDAETDLFISAASSTGSIVAGSDTLLSYILTIGNDGPSDASGVVVTNRLPSGVTFVAAEGCEEADSRGNLSCPIGDLAVGDITTRTITVTVDASTIGRLLNRANVSRTEGGPYAENCTETDPNTENNSARVNTEVVTEADLFLTMTGAPDSIVAGSDNPLVYTLTVGNSGPSDARDVVVTDTLPADVELFSTSGCEEDVGAPSCTLGTIPAGESKTYSIEVRVNSDATGTLVNGASAVSSTPEANPGDESASEETSVTTAADLVVTKEASTNPVIAGTSFSYTVTVGNNGPSDAKDVVVTDTLPAGVDLISASGCDQNPVGTLVCNLGTIPADGSTSLDIEVGVDPDARDDLVNEVIVSSVTPENVAGDESDAEIVGVNTEADLAVFKTASAETIFSGETLTYTVVVRNAGPSDAQDVVVTDILPSGVELLSTRGCIEDPSGSPECTLGTIPAGTSKQYTLNVTVDLEFSGTLTNFVQVASGTTESKPGNESASLQVEVLPAPGGIIVEKQTVPDGVPDEFTFMGDAEDTIRDNERIVVTDLEPGTYTSTEILPDGWKLDSIECSDGNSSGDVESATATFALEAGETVTCVFTNRRPNTVVIRKRTAPQGVPDEFTFTGAVAGTIRDGQQIFEHLEPDPVPCTEPDEECSNYTVKEEDPEDESWVLESIDCDDNNSSGDLDNAEAHINLEDGEVITCVFTSRLRDSIAVRKKTDPEGLSDDFVFTGDAAGTIQGGGQIVVRDQEPGAYTATEMVPEGWDLTAIECTDDDSTVDLAEASATFQLEDDEAVTCTFVNTKRSSLVVEKRTVPEGAPDEFSFTGDAAGTIAGGGRIELDDLKPGTYSVTEVLSEDWDLRSIACDDGNSTGDLATATATFNLEPGETVTCTFTNTRELALIVEKQGTGTGTLTSVPAGISCDPACSGDAAVFPQGGLVVLTASPAQGSTFVGWSGDCSGSEAVTTVTLDSVKTCIATFEASGDEAQCAHPPDGLTAWWPFDETSGTAVADVARAHNGRHLGHPEPVPGWIGGALMFDGIDAAVDVPDRPGLDPGRGDFSIVLWLRTEERDWPVAVMDKRLELKPDGEARGYLLYLSDGEPGLEVDGTAFGSATYVADGAWHLVAVTVDRDDPAGGRWYLDGIELGATFDPTIVPGSLDNDASLRIGGPAFRDPATLIDPESSFHGALDEVLIFDRALTADEVRALQEAERVGMCRPADLYLDGGRFQVHVDWRDADGNTGTGSALLSRSEQSGVFWFFRTDEWEILVKVIDGCRVNGHFWFLAAATTDLEYTLRVTDTRTGSAATYFNPLGNRAPALADTEALAVCTEDAAATQSFFRLEDAPSGGPATTASAASEQPAAECIPSPGSLCLNHGRFRVEVDWSVPEGDAGFGQVVPFGSERSGLFWFFEPESWEVLVKVLDGCAVNGHFWVLAASVTDLGYTLRVVDTESGVVREYDPPPGQAAGVADVEAFSTCLGEDPIPKEPLVTMD